MSLKLCLVASLLSAAALAEVVQFRACDSGSEKPNCTVKEVRVHPCPEAASEQPCKFKKGINASIEFDFTAGFNAEKLNQKAYWATIMADIPLMGMDSNGCNYVKCPINEGELYHYSNALHISKNFPSQRFDVKWKVWDEANKDEHMCCFIFKIKLV